MSASLATPTLDLLQDYAAALRRGWSDDNLRGQAAADEALEQIASDPQGFLALCDNPEGRGPPYKLLDGTTAPRLPSLRRWIWDDGFCGSIGLRWSPGGGPLPSWFEWGHAGYAVPPWKQGRGYATAGLGLVLPLARERGLAWLELTTDAGNRASQRVVEKNGGYVISQQDGRNLHGGGTSCAGGSISKIGKNAIQP